MNAKLPLAPFGSFKLLRELRSKATDRRPLVLGGARSLVDALRRELVRDGDATAVREEALGAMVGAAALVYVLAGEPTEDDERALRAADLAGVPLLVFGPEPTTEVSLRARDGRASAPTRRRVPARGARPTAGRQGRERGRRARREAAGAPKPASRTR